MANSTPMFHQGDLNSGIARAIQEKKVVACFISEPNNHESQIWEDYWLANKSQPTDMISSDVPPVGLMIAEKAVLLKLELGSQEVGFLNAFCAVERAPTLVVVHNGRVLERLEPGISREEFEEKLLAAVGFGNPSEGTRQPEGPPDDEVVEASVGDIGGQQTAVTSATSAQSAPQESAQSTENIQAMLSERGQRLEADRVRREAAEKAERVARAQARRKEEENAAAASSSNKHQSATEQKDKQQARDAWIYQQKQRKDEAKKERERILSQIEADRQERKAQAARKKEADSQTAVGAFSEMPAAADKTTTLPVRSAHSSCALQVRLFDGSSIRGKFEPTADIATAVRTWVNEASPEGGADIPYTFRQILAPQPSKSIEVSEEHQSLQELGLVPSATLVLVPVAGATAAYSNAGRGYMSSALHAAYWAANTAYGVLGTAWSYVPSMGSGESGPYMGGTGDEQERSNVQGANMAGSDSAAPGGSGGKVRSFAAGQRKKDDQTAEFYNGNSSAFEGRKDDGEDAK